MDTLSPNDLFSPSKAALHRATAQDWAYLETWLTSLYRARTLPPFERNADTLSALLALAAANEKAEEQTGLLNRARREALEEGEEDEDAIPDSTLQIHDAITASLPAETQTILSSLARATALLPLSGGLIASSSSAALPLAHDIIHLTTTNHDLAQQLTHLRALHTHLESHHSVLESHLSTLKSAPEFTTPPSLPQKTAEYTRQTRHLRSKLTEYSSRLSGMPDAESTGGSPSALSAAGIADVVRAEEDIASLMDRVAQLEAQVDAFKGLPPDPEAARQQVRRLEQDVQKLRAKRDRLFEEMVDT